MHEFVSLCVYTYICVRVCVHVCVDVLECKCVLLNLLSIVGAGLHNGHTILGNDWICVPLIEEPDSQDVLLLSLKSIDIPGFVAHELMALVFVVEYELGTPVPKHTHLNSNTILQSTMQNGKLLTTIAVGAGLHLPYAGGTLILCSPADHGSRLHTKHEAFDGIEIDIRPDDLCSSISPVPIYLDTEGSPLAATKKSRVTVSAVAAGKRADESDDESEAEMSFSFVLSAFDATGEERHHGEEVNVEDDTATTKARKEQAAESSEIAEEKRTSTRTPQKYKPATTGPKRQPSGHDDDAMSVSDSLVGGDSEAPTLRLDTRYYVDKSKGTQAHNENARPSDGFSVSSAHSSNGQFVLPRDALSVSLWSRAVATKLGTNAMLKVPSATGNASKPTSNFGSRPAARHIDLTTERPSATDSHFRDLSRGAKSRLNRHGFDHAIDDSGRRMRPSPSLLKDDRMSIETEATDPLSLHDISLQFAGFRPSSSTVGTPKNVFFTFQFYTCEPTKSEVLRLLPADAGQVHVFVREDARDESPLSLRFRIDCSAASPTEPYDFAEYLSHSSLHIDVWNADSLLLVIIAAMCIFCVIATCIYLFSTMCVLGGDLHSSCQSFYASRSTGHKGNNRV